VIEAFSSLISDEQAPVGGLFITVVKTQNLCNMSHFKRLFVEIRIYRLSQLINLWHADEVVKLDDNFCK
jgi:hypothetical protein